MNTDHVLKRVVAHLREGELHVYLVLQCDVLVQHMPTVRITLKPFTKFLEPLCKDSVEYFLPCSCIFWGSFIGYKGICRA
jgi:hypothetical protein